MKEQKPKKKKQRSKQSGQHNQWHAMMIAIRSDW